MKHEEATFQTKTALAASLKKSMAKKPFAKISVSELVTDANVNRKTFYYHFEDVYALLKWMLDMEAIEVVRQFDLLIDYEDAICFVIHYVQENKHILNCAHDSSARDELKSFIFYNIATIVRRVVNDCEQQNALEVDEDFKTFISSFVSEAISGMLVTDFKSRKVPDEQQVVRHFGIILEALPDMLKRAADQIWRP